MAAQIKAAGRFEPEAQQRYVEDFNRSRTQKWVASCHL